MAASSFIQSVITPAMDLGAMERELDRISQALASGTCDQISLWKYILFNALWRVYLLDMPMCFRIRGPSFTCTGGSWRCCHAF